MTVYVSQSQTDAYPTVRVRFKSLYLWEVGPDKALNEARGLILQCFGKIEKEKVSRVDFCADFRDIDMDWSSFRKFVSKATDRNLYFVGSDELSGFNFGRGRIKARVYDKSREIRRNKKKWFFDLWGVSEDEVIWRVEFQLRRDFLKEYDVEDFESFKDVVADIWRYLSNEWLAMRELDNENVSRRSLTPFWERVTSSIKIVEFSYGKLTGVLRNVARDIKEESLIQIVRGLVISISAIRLNRKKGEVEEYSDVEFGKSDFMGLARRLLRSIMSEGIVGEIEERAVALP